MRGDTGLEVRHNQVCVIVHNLGSTYNYDPCLFLLKGSTIPVIYILFAAFCTLNFLMILIFADPEKRQRGWPSYIGLLVLLGCSIANVLDRLGVVDL